MPASGHSLARAIVGAKTPAAVAAAKGGEDARRLIASGGDSQAYRVQTRQRRRKNMATIEWRKSVAESRPRHQIPKRHRGHQNVRSPRRLIDRVTQSPA
jgi:hypothetical protein